MDEIKTIAAAARNSLDLNRLYGCTPADINGYLVKAVNVAFRELYSPLERKEVYRRTDTGTFTGLYRQVFIALIKGE